jgi:hypothetical protein
MVTFIPLTQLISFCFLLVGFQVILLDLLAIFVHLPLKKMAARHIHIFMGASRMLDAIETLDKSNRNTNIQSPNIVLYREIEPIRKVQDRTASIILLELQSERFF